MSTPAAKSREEVLAERRGKKKNKASKSKLKGKPSGTATEDNTLQEQTVAHNIEWSSESTSSVAPCVVGSSKLSDLSGVKAAELLPGDNNENHESSAQKLIDALERTTMSGGDPVQKMEIQSKKSREEILAEREAKRLTKQAAKVKSKTGARSAEASNVETDKENQKKLCEETMKLSISESNNVLEKHDSAKSNETNEGKTNAQLRAERRAKQEAQRAKKIGGENKPINTNTPKTAADTLKVTKVSPVVKSTHKVKLFAHLYADCSDTCSVDMSADVHPAVLRLGTQYTSRVISGSNVRCLALLNVLKMVITDFETPQNQEFSRGLEAKVTKSMAFLNRCRPVAVSMVNAVKHLKFQISQVKVNEREAKSQINEWIDTYIKEQLETAAEAICISVREKISHGDVILTYGCSSLVQRILISAHKENIKFRVIVVDGRPWLEGREMLRKLVSVGIHCTYVFVNGLSFIMPEVTKILLGAHALLANGYVMSRAGSSQIALLAKTYNVPVLVCCETQKFSERVQTDSFVYNELGNPDDLLASKGGTLKGACKLKSVPYLTPLNLTYDVTPPDLVSAVVTEIAVLPCTSVPVILRIKPPEISC